MTLISCRNGCAFIMFKYLLRGHFGFSESFRFCGHDISYLFIYGFSSNFGFYCEFLKLKKKITCNARKNCNTKLFIFNTFSFLLFADNIQVFSFLCPFIFFFAFFCLFACLLYDGSIMSDQWNSIAPNLISNWNGEEILLALYQTR